MITEEVFAQEEARLGQSVHMRNGIWWVRVAPGYCKPVHEFRLIAPGSFKPRLLRSWIGYSHQVPDPVQGNRSMVWNMLQGAELKNFSLERLRSKRRNMVRGGLRDCRVDVMLPEERILEQMRQINISQAQRFEAIQEKPIFLPPDYYTTHASKWRADMLKLFSHAGHQFIGAFVNERLAAYSNVIRIEGTWMFGAVKSHQEELKHRPVDALYFYVLSRASQSSDCQRVVNGGGEDERPSLTSFKRDFLLNPVVVPYYTRTLIPLDRLRQLKNIFQSRRAKSEPSSPVAQE
ncbi:MAG: hypothetical protein RBS84_00450 [Kiritimatiellia bacterium]|jgi:hypothetical protein|nr:hypothetical protein [Kiritimatiellia bacterium]